MSFFNVAEPLYPFKIHGNGKAFLFCTFFDMQCDNPLIRKLPTYRVHTRSRTHSIPELKVGCAFHSIYRQWKSLKMKLIATSGRKLRYRRDDIAAAVGSNWSIKHRSQGMDRTKNLKHGCLFVDVRLLCYLTCCSL